MYCTDIRTTARLLDLSPSAIYARIRRQRMPYIVFRKHYLIEIKDIAMELDTNSKADSDALSSTTELIKLMQRQKLPIWFCQETD